MKTAKEIAELAERQIAAAKEVEKAESTLKSAKEHHRWIAEELLPNAMREAEMTAFTLDNGFKISINDEVSASITGPKRNEAVAWLREHGFGGLVKTEVTALFPREEAEQALEFATELSERYGEDRIELLENVHPSTLKAWLKEQLAAGTNVPLDTFGARTYTIAKITAPKSSGR